MGSVLEKKLFKVKGIILLNIYEYGCIIHLLYYMQYYWVFFCKNPKFRLKAKFRKVTFELFNNCAM